MTERVPLDFVRQSLSYDPKTGEFEWRDRPWLRASVNARTRFKRAGTKSDGYIRITLTYEGVEIRLLGHRVAWALMNGAWPTDEIDHRDNDGFNNEWLNLRSASSEQNKHNTRGWRKRSLGKGVYFNKRRGHFFSSITSNGKTHYLGSFDSPEDAREAYRIASIQLNGEYANEGGWN